MDSESSQRPALSPELAAAEFQRWYWLKDELASFARTLGIRASGSKELLAARVSAALEGKTFAEPAPVRRVSGRQLSGELAASTVIPAGQRSSQVVRTWMTANAGPAFHFDAEMREFFVASDGTQTMQDALEHWRATRDQPVRTIDPQFEYNRFTRAWHEAHPLGSREEVLAAWREYRALPKDERSSE